MFPDLVDELGQRCMFQEMVDSNALSAHASKKVAGASMQMRAGGLWMLYCLSCLHMLSDEERELRAIDELS